MNVNKLYLTFCETKNNAYLCIKYTGCMNSWTDSKFYA